MSTPSSMVNLLEVFCIASLLFGYTHSIPIVNPFGFPKIWSNNFEISYKGKWELVTQNSGVVGMHIQLMPNGHLVIYDATEEGDSKINLPPGAPCRLVLPREGEPPGSKSRMDCLAHAIDYNPEDGNIRPLKVNLSNPIYMIFSSTTFQVHKNTSSITVTFFPFIMMLQLESNAWCSSGGLNADGTFSSTGGWYEGGRAVRYIKDCPTCDWYEYRTGMGSSRW
ncbi:hypothetical protein QQ045_024529 [Rhodiola kirilowii]